MGPSQLDPLFNPESVAVFGASESGTSVGSLVFSNLVKTGFEGPIVPINPKYKKVGGKPCFASISEVEEDIDLAVIATPARTVPGIVGECAEVGIRHVSVLSAGFGETGEEGKALRAELIDIARRSGVRFMGPNSVGLVRPWNNLNATFLKAGTPQGGLALVSQSGALCSAISDWAEPNHLGFSALVSLGNSANIDFGDVLRFLSTDPKTEAILLYVEGIRDARNFVSALRVAARMKPVIVLKAGRHSQSSAAATTHTGALIGSDDVFDAALERAGAVRVHTFGQLFAAAEILSNATRAGGNRLCIITNGGGAGVLAADRAGDLHIDLVRPSQATIDALDTFLPPYWSKSNPIDILGDARPEAYGKTLEIALADPSYGGVLVMLTPQAMTEATEAAEAVIEAAADAKKPVLSCWMGQTSVAEARTLLSSNGIADFTTPERAVEAFSYLARHEHSRRLALETPGPLSDAQAPDSQGARMIIEAALADDRTMLSDVESKAVLRAFRIPVNTTIEADDAAAALVAAETVGFPVAMKINSPQISHKSDVGGVKINIMNAADVRIAWREMTDNAKRLRPDAEIKGVTVEAMASIGSARELVIGSSRDPVFGPSILFGAGGTMVEVLKDSAVTLPPLNSVLAERLIQRTRVSRLLEAFRDSPAVDRGKVIDVLLRLSELVCELPEVEELDINPLMAGPDAVLAVDARIRIARQPGSADRYDHMAISPYPFHLIRREVLHDGTTLTIRPIRPEDAESEQTFVRGLSPDARHFRFMQTLNELTPAMLARFTQIDYSWEMAFVAIIEEDGEPVQHGVARYVTNPDEKSCEFAVVVSDSHQNRGIGTRLMKALMDAARDHGLTTMEGTVLADNHPMLELMDELGFKTRRDEDDVSLVIVERWL